jgi:hypothetical protein
MDPIQNPFNPGAGTPPPELAGRHELLEKVRICTERLRIGHAAKSLILVGLRGVGKTVLLDRMRTEAISRGICVVRVEAQEDQSLPAMLAPEIRLAMLRLSRVEAAKEKAQQALRALAGFFKALKVKYRDMEIGLDFEPEKGLADNGQLEHDLSVLLGQAGQAALAAQTVLAIFIDELQYVPREQFAALIGALHRCAQDQSPVMLVGAGLPQLLALAGTAKSYAERLFDYPFVGQLSPEAASEALCKPVEKLGVRFEQAAIEKLIQYTQGYPYFLQEWGKHTWDMAEISPITVTDVERATTWAIASLDESFFKVRLEPATPAERRYLAAMAQLGAGPHRSGKIAPKMAKKSSQLGPVRDSLIKKGLIWSPAHGDTAFTVPLFHEYLQRTLGPDLT